MTDQSNTQGLYNYEAVTTPGDDTQIPLDVDKVQANLFFDGTLNNYYNVTTRDQKVRAAHDGDNTSYDNGLSNVARMWKPISLERDGPDIAVYVEGIGTARDQGDSMLGYAMGTGETGIEVRAQSAFEPLLELVAQKRGKRGLPAILELNLFGFSRGAATARHFASLLRNPKEVAKHFVDRWSKVHVQVNFVGLFDTVSSEGGNFGNDVEGLQLRFVQDAAKRVFHLVALDEYRMNFSLTTIASACQATSLIDGVRAPMGFELSMPGAHSDVGGGYKAGVLPQEMGVEGNAPLQDIEIRELAPTRKADKGQTLRGPQAFVYAKGWYSEKDRDKSLWKAYRHERTVTGDYYKVGLSIMVDMAEKYTTTVYPGKLKADMQVQTPDIQPVQQALRELAKTQAFAPGKTRARWALDEQLGAESAKEFRHQYLHLSLSTRTGMGPRFKNDTELERSYEEG